MPTRGKRQSIQTRGRGGKKREGKMDAHVRNVLLAGIGIQVADANFGLDETNSLASLPFPESETDGQSGGVLGNEIE